jgi:WD40 repeat protein
VEPPQKLISAGKVAAIFSEWRARRAAANPPKPQRAAEPAAPSAPPKSEPKPVAAAEAAAKSNLPAVIERRIPPRPARPKRKWPWRSLAVKGAIGLTVASLAVIYQDALPKVERQGSSTISSGSLPTPQVAQIKGHKGAVDGVAHTSDGRFIVTTGNDRTLKVWQNGSRSLVRSIDLDASTATSLAVGENRAVTGHKAGRVAVWNLDSGARIAEFKRNEADIWAVAFAGSPDRVLAAGHDWKLTLFDVRTPVLPVHVFDGHESAVQAVAYSAPRGLIATGGADRTVRLWNAETLETMRVYRGHQDYVTALAFIPDGRHLASGDLSGVVRIWSVTTRRLQRSIRAHKGGITSLAYSSDGHWLATAGRDGLVRMWDLQRQRPPRTFVGHAGDVNALSFAPDGATLASAGADGVVRLWSTTFMAGRGS